MCGCAAHLVDHVIDDVPLRQWVLSVPFELRLGLAKHPEALYRVGRIFVLTQERLQILLLKLDPNHTIDLVVVDEAQSLGESNRGMLLQTCLEALVDHEATR